MVDEKVIDDNEMVDLVRQIHILFSRKIMRDTFDLTNHHQPSHHLPSTILSTILSHLPCLLSLLSWYIFHFG